MRDPRRTSSKVDHEVQGLNGVTGFIPLIVKVLANLRLRVNIFDHLETKQKKPVNLVLKKRKEEKNNNWQSFDPEEIRLVFSYSGNGWVEIIRTIPFTLMHNVWYPICFVLWLAADIMSHMQCWPLVCFLLKPKKYRLDSRVSLKIYDSARTWRYNIFRISHLVSLNLFRGKKKTL